VHRLVRQQEQDGRTDVAALDSSTPATLWPASAASCLAASMTTWTVPLAGRIALTTGAAFPTTSPRLLKLFNAMSTFVSHDALLSDLKIVSRYIAICSIATSCLGYRALLEEKRDSGFVMIAGRTPWFDRAVSGQLSSFVSGWLLGLGMVERQGRPDLPRTRSAMPEMHIQVPQRGGADSHRAKPAAL